MHFSPIPTQAKELPATMRNMHCCVEQSESGLAASGLGLFAHLKMCRYHTSGPETQLQSLILTNITWWWNHIREPAHYLWRLREIAPVTVSLAPPTSLFLCVFSSLIPLVTVTLNMQNAWRRRDVCKWKCSSYGKWSLQGSGSKDGLSVFSGILKLKYLN